MLFWKKTHQSVPCCSCDTIRKIPVLILRDSYGRFPWKISPFAFPVLQPWFGYVVAGFEEHVLSFGGELMATRQGNWYLASSWGVWYLPSWTVLFIDRGKNPHPLPNMYFKVLKAKQKQMKESRNLPQTLTRGQLDFPSYFLSGRNFDRFMCDTGLP